MDIIVSCPHCNKPIVILELNCKIFRHAVLKESGNQINPHTSKVDCDELIKNDKIYGCGKPFRIIQDNNIYKAIDCDYI